MSRAKTTKAKYRGKERRGSFRRQASFPTDITRVNQFKFKKKWDHEVGVNIGITGLCIRSMKPLPEKANVTLAILLYNDEAELVETDAKLLWTQRRIVDRQKLYYMGLEFTNLNPQTRDLIQHFIDGKL